MNTLVPCTYRNLANHPQVLRIAELPNYFERTVYPKQCIAFNAPLGAVVEIHECMTALPSDSFLCEELRAISTEALLQLQTTAIA